MDSVINSSAGSKRAFTLVELLISLSLAMLLLAGVLQAITFLSKSQVLSSHYVELNAQSRASLEWMADDVRQMQGVSILSQGFSGTIETASGSVVVRYEYNPDLGVLLRRTPDGDRVLWENVASCDFEYHGAGSMDLAASPPRLLPGEALQAGSSTKVKRIRMQLGAEVSVMGIRASQQSISANFTVRP